MICVGDTRLEQPEGTRELREGKVIFVHPSGRWYTVEFSFPGMNKVRSYRECFFASLKPRIGVNKDKMRDTRRN